MPTDEAYREVLRRLDKRDEKAKPMAEEKGELHAELAGQKIDLKNVSLNTIATVATLILCSVIAYVIWTHQQDTKDASSQFVAALKEQTSALREQTVAAREQNCLMRFDQKERSERADFCKSLAR